MVADTYTTTTDRTQMIEMALDGTPEEVYHSGRLSTLPRENGIALVAYGEHILAEIEGYDIHFYTGHYGEHSETVDRYISQIGSLLNDTSTRNVTVHETETPSLMARGGRVSEAGKYISNYIGDVLSDTRSPVEADAKAEVNDALRERMSVLLG